jgi:hypothetical protein
MTSRQELAHESKLLDIVAAKRFVPSATFDDPDVRKIGLDLIRKVERAVDRKSRKLLQEAVHRPTGKPPPGVVPLLRLGLGIAGARRYALLEHPDEMKQLPLNERQLRHWIANPITVANNELEAGIRLGLGSTDDDDTKIIEARLGQLFRRDAMPTVFIFDPRAVPLGFNEADFKRIVAAEVTSSVPSPIKDSTKDFIFGAMSLDGFLPQTSEPVLRETARRLSFESGGKTKRLTPLPGPPVDPFMINREAYELVAQEIIAIRTPLAGTGQAFYEELAFVARRLISNAGSVPIDAPGLRARVQEALTLYVPGQAGGTLELPPLDSAEVAGTDLVRDNIRAVALIYAAWNLEEMQLFRVHDRVLEVFMNGQLPVGFDNGGRALSDYYFSADEVKISEAARRMTYTRVLGVPGGEVSREAPANAIFQDLFLALLAHVSEFDRQRRIADVVAGSNSRDDMLSLTGEQVRKAGRDLAANATLYGYGGVFFVAQRLKDQVEQVLRNLSTPEILSAYGVQSPFQVVERVCATDFGGKVPNIVRYKTMAEAGKKILDIVAGNIPAWLGLSGNDLFEDPFDVFRANAAANIVVPAPPAVNPPTPPDIPRDVQRELARAVEDWLTVNGITDEQRSRLGEPKITQAAPSIPTATDGGGGPAFDQLRQMVAGGQMPSMDQLKALLPDGGGMVRM